MSSKWTYIGVGTVVGGLIGKGLAVGATATSGGKVLLVGIGIGVSTTALVVGCAAYGAGVGFGLWLGNNGETVSDHRPFDHGRPPKSGPEGATA